MRRCHSAAVVFGVLLLSQAAWAFDPRTTDILTLQLGMDESTISARLRAQGIDEAAIAHERSPEGTEVIISAMTIDGRLTIVTGAAGARSIAYRIYRRGGTSPEMVRAAVIGRYGPPNSLAPMVWCQRPLASGRCPADRPRLAFELRPDGESVTSLIGSPN